MRILWQRETPADIATRPQRRRRTALSSVIGWLRAGYPDEAPRTGYSPLLALNGPRALTPRDIETVMGDLEDGQRDATEIAVAITKATDRLPSQRQTRAIVDALAKRATPPS